MLIIKLLIFSASVPADKSLGLLSNIRRNIIGQASNYIPSGSMLLNNILQY
jgi:hypothetical protein